MSSAAGFAVVFVALLVMGATFEQLPIALAAALPVLFILSVVDEDGDFGFTDPSVLGVRLPILSVMGDQHAAMVALGAHRPGQAMCVHGTGTAWLVTGQALHALVIAGLVLGGHT
ncbi:hypothetical protein [Actinomadura mexicana]|uniref:Uncharacterized protein n=1 Tax=Actinomadura mexicana TaxID=134959 RepID=A0A239BV56_9ACTN|nr:hypothetical protein [Actinomadura mexicana]SNS11925.1 hypothetical protein SAMN06265355_111132 [Actinomadura mexicana]